MATKHPLTKVGSECLASLWNPTFTSEVVVGNVKLGKSRWNVGENSPHSVKIHQHLQSPTQFTRHRLDPPTLTATSIFRLPLPLHPFSGLFSRTTWESRYQKGNTKRWCGLGWQWHQLDHMQTMCTLLQTDNHTNTSSLNLYRPDALPDAQPTVSKHWRQTSTFRLKWKISLQ